MPCRSTSDFSGSLVELHCFVQFRERQALENHALDGEELGFRWKFSRPFSILCDQTGPTSSPRFFALLFLSRPGLSAASYAAGLWPRPTFSPTPSQLAH